MTHPNVLLHLCFSMSTCTLISKFYSCYVSLSPRDYSFLGDSGDTLLSLGQPKFENSTLYNEH